jgi:hypothetical protein
MFKGLNPDKIGRDKASKIEKEKMKVMQDRMEFIQKGIKVLQEKAQVRIIPVLKTTPQAIQANIELVPESEKSLEECLAEYAFRKNEEKLESEKAEAEPHQEKHPGLR